jgi:hypothetical protein
MHLDPLLPNAGHSSFRQPAIVQRALHMAGAGHPPISEMIAGGFVNLSRVDTQPDEVPPPSVGALPLFPVIQAHPPPQPLVQCRCLSIALLTAVPGQFSAPAARRQSERGRPELDQAVLVVVNRFCRGSPGFIRSRVTPQAPGAEAANAAIPGTAPQGGRASSRSLTYRRPGDVRARGDARPP